MLTKSFNQMTSIAEKIKKTDHVDQQNPLTVAETELKKAANSIEQAAQRLAELKPKSEIVDQVELGPIL